MFDHAERAHSEWSASATERNWNCSGALAFTADLPDVTSEPADWGTVVHEISEVCLRSNGDPADFIGRKMKGKVFEFEVDQEMVDVAEKYLGYVRAETEKSEGSTLFVEQKFSLAALNPPFGAGGTADAVIYHPKEKLLEVVDLKTGRGVRVNAQENKQLRTYALGAMLANKGLSVVNVKSTIVQPRIYNEPVDETYHVADLLEWTSDLMEKMEASKSAKAEYAEVVAGNMPRSVWVAKWLTAGDHCSKTFCKAAGFCPALEQRALDAAGVWFDDLDRPRISNTPDKMTPEELSKRLDTLDMITDWVAAVRAYAHTQAELGVEIPEYILVPKEGREKWIDDAAAAKAVSTALAVGLTEDKVQNAPKPRTPKQIRDALKKAKLGEAIAKLDGLSSAKSEGTNLVRATKTTRSAVAPAAHQHFDILD